MRSRMWCSFSGFWFGGFRARGPSSRSRNTVCLAIPGPRRLEQRDVQPGYALARSPFQPVCPVAWWIRVISFLQKASAMVFGHFGAPFLPGSPAGVFAFSLGLDLTACRQWPAETGTPAAGQCDSELGVSVSGCDMRGIPAAPRPPGGWSGAWMMSGTFVTGSDDGRRPAWGLLDDPRGWNTVRMMKQPSFSGSNSVSGAGL